MGAFARSDLAVECAGEMQSEGVQIQKSCAGGCEVTRVRVRDTKAAERIGKPCGRYVTVECGSIGTLEEQERERVRCVLAVEIRALALKMCKKRIDAQFSVLVVGLGNREMSPDAIGAETVRQLSVTRHLQSGERIALTGPSLCEIAAIAPGVTGQTGMEAQELVRGLVEVLHPDLVVAVDALVARAPERLAATVQLSDAGIAPGSGIGARRRALCAESVGAPVLALGVPTVVDCATLVSDALTAAGFGVFSEEIEKRVQTGRNFLVSPREVDLLARRAGLLLAESLEKAFSFA